MRTREQILDRAHLHVGHHETSENRSPLIDAWLRRCGVGPGLAWCAAFASWCLEDVAIAGALKLGEHYPPTDHPEPGDLMFFATGAGHGHIGIAEVVGLTDVVCIEGNSANSVRRVRRLRSEVRFASTRDEDWPLSATVELHDAPLVHVTKVDTL